MAWSVLNFGKHKGKTLPQIIFIDPDWFFWSMEDKDFYKKKSVSLHDEAATIYKRATRIRIPNNADNNLVVEYNFYPGTFNSIGFDIVPRNRPPHRGSTGTFRADLIDFAVPRMQKDYDKLGYKLFISSVKSSVFGSTKTRMNKAKCEKFFDDEANFMSI